MSDNSEVLDKLDEIYREAQKDIERVKTVEDAQNWHREFLGRKGLITEILRTVGNLPEKQRPLVGQKANEIKKALEEALGMRQESIARQELENSLKQASVDVTLPGRPYGPGKYHPTTTTLREICAIFGRMGFQIYDGPEVETDEYNFGFLNMPPGHPARDMWDTFYTTVPDLILRTHTSPGQIHVMREHAPKPIRVILPGKVYRYEQVTARSESMFYQVEGLAIGNRITFSDLKGVLLHFANQMFGPGRSLRFRKSYFPFTEPSVEVDVDCILCQRKGCQVCKHSGWLEILGAGMVNPVVLQNGGYNPCEYNGFAFGMGPERIAMLKHGISDIRYFYTNHVKFLENF